MSLQDAIARNRARQAVRYSIFDCLTRERVSESTYPTADEANHDYHMNAGHTYVGIVAPTRRDEGLKAYTVNVLVVPPNAEIALGLATMHEETRTIYGTSLADAKKRAGIE